MKKLLILVAIFSSTAVFAQQNVVKINILSPIVKTINVSFEHALSETGSLQLGLFYTGYSVDETKFSGFGITPEYRFYLSSSPAPDGFYVAPFARYQSFKLTDDFTDSEGKFSAFGGGLVIGRQWIFKERISLDLFLGPQFISGNVDVTDGEDSFNVDVFDGFGLRTGITFGVAF